MRKTIILIVVWIAALLLIGINIIINPHSLFVNGTILFGWLLFAIQITWNQSERFYMLIKKGWFMFKNPDCIWNMQVEFTGSFNYDVFAVIDKVFAEQGKEYKITNLSITRKQYKVGTIKYEVVTSSEQIRLEVEDLEVSFRRSKNIIQDEIGILLENLSRVLKEDETDYYLNINFKEYNPYFGFFVRRLNAHEINTFNVKFQINNERVSINKSSIELQTDSLNKLTKLSKEYLTLSPQ